MKAFYSDVFELPLPANHRFPMAKYRLLRDRVVALSEHYPIELTVAEAATDEQLGLVHSDSYLRRVVAGELTDREVRRIGFPWSRELVERSRRSVGATVGAARAALADRVAVNLAGGTHHAFAERGQGYCVFNDVAVAMRVLQAESQIERAVVIDCDVHQGNGTAAIFAGDPSVTTFSMHGDRNFPFAKVPSDWDVALADGTGDADYLRLLQESLDGVLLDGADCVFYLAGADPYRQDRLGRLKLTISGLRERDRLVLSACRERRLPVSIVMAGGYARDVRETVEIHAATVRLASELFLQAKT